MYSSMLRQLEKRKVCGGNTHTNNNMSQHYGTNCIKLYNLSPFSKSLWKNIGIFERNRIKNKRRCFPYSQLQFTMSLLYCLPEHGSFIKQKKCISWRCRDSFGIQGNRTGNTLCEYLWRNLLELMILSYLCEMISNNFGYSHIFSFLLMLTEFFFQKRSNPIIGWMSINSS